MWEDLKKPSPRKQIEVNGRRDTRLDQSARQDASGQDQSYSERVRLSQSAAAARSNDDKRTNGVTDGYSGKMTVLGGRKKAGGQSRHEKASRDEMPAADSSRKSQAAGSLNQAAAALIKMPVTQPGQVAPSGQAQQMALPSADGASVEFAALMNSLEISAQKTTKADTLTRSDAQVGKRKKILIIFKMSQMDSSS